MLLLKGSALNRKSDQNQLINKIYKEKKNHKAKNEMRY